MRRFFNSEQVFADDGTPFQLPGVVDPETGHAEASTPSLTDWLSLLLSTWQQGPGRGKVDGKVEAIRLRKIMRALLDAKPGSIVELDDDHFKWLYDTLFVQRTSFTNQATGESVNGAWAYNAYGPFVGLAIDESLETEPPKE